MLDNPITQRLQAWAGERVTRSEALSGGCIADARKISFASGKTFVLKAGAGQTGMFEKEANGLIELAKAKVIRIPEVLLAEDDFILIEFIGQGSGGAGFFENFGRRFANLHDFQAEKFGFYEDNFIGATVQKNLPSGEEARSWPAFYLNKRLLFQFRLAEQRGSATREMRDGFRNLENKIEEILVGGDEPPALLHGDLWSGNFLVDHRGEPCLIDPAVYYGHREADLAMTKLFGGFDPRFYAAYQERRPLPPGHEYREDLYKLYHVMNHLNLFGRGYYSQAIAILREYA